MAVFTWMPLMAQFQTQKIYTPEVEFRFYQGYYEYHSDKVYRLKYSKYNQLDATVTVDTNNACRSIKYFENLINNFKSRFPDVSVSVENSNPWGGLTIACRSFNFKPGGNSSTYLLRIYSDNNIAVIYEIGHKITDSAAAINRILTPPTILKKQKIFNEQHIAVPLSGNVKPFKLSDSSNIIVLYPCDKPENNWKVAVNWDYLARDENDVKNYINNHWTGLLKMKQYTAASKMDYPRFPETLRNLKAIHKSSLCLQYYEKNETGQRVFMNDYFIVINEKLNILRFRIFFSQPFRNDQLSQDTTLALLLKDFLAEIIKKSTPPERPLNTRLTLQNFPGKSHATIGNSDYCYSGIPESEDSLINCLPGGINADIRMLASKANWPPSTEEIRNTWYTDPDRYIKWIESLNTYVLCENENHYLLFVAAEQNQHLKSNERPEYSFAIVAHKKGVRTAGNKQFTEVNTRLRITDFSTDRPATIRNTAYWHSSYYGKDTILFSGFSGSLKEDIAVLAKYNYWPRGIKRKNHDSMLSWMTKLRTYIIGETEDKYLLFVPKEDNLHLDVADRPEYSHMIIMGKRGVKTAGNPHYHEYNTNINSDVFPDRKPAIIIDPGYKNYSFNAKDSLLLVAFSEPLKKDIIALADNDNWPKNIKNSIEETGLLWIRKLRPYIVAETEDKYLLFISKEDNQNLGYQAPEYSFFLIIDKAGVRNTLSNWDEILSETIAKNASDYKLYKPAIIIQPEQINTYIYRDIKLGKCFSKEKVNSVRYYSDPDIWPHGTHSLLFEYKTYAKYLNVYIVCETKEHYILHVPTNCNWHLQEGWTPAFDFYIIMNKSGVALR